MSTLQRARQLMQQKKWTAAKHALLEMIENEDTRSETFMSMGDVCKALNEIDDALLYYQQCLEIAPSNGTACIKIGDIYSDCKSDYDQAFTFYQQCLSVDRENALCYLQLGKLAFKQGNFYEAEQFYLQSNFDIACVNYHYGFLLLHCDAPDPEKALPFLRKATQIRGDCHVYHFECAQCLHQLHNLEEADKEYLIALKQSQFENVRYLHEYAVFLADTCGDLNEASRHLKMAMRCAEYRHSKYPEIRRCLDSLRKAQQNMGTVRSEVKCVIFDLEQTLTYCRSHPEQAIHWSSRKIRDDIYGGEDRVQRLHAHFRRIQNAVRMVVFSNRDVETTTHSLRMVQLLQYFDNADNSNIICNVQPIAICEEIKQFAARHNLHAATEIMYVDDDSKTIEQCSEYCVTYCVQSTGLILNGLSLQHFADIEQELKVYDEHDRSADHEFEAQLRAWQKLPTLQQSLPAINDDIYRTVKREVREYTRNGGQCDCITSSVPVLKWMRAEWKTRVYRRHFEVFAKCYALLQKYKPSDSFWSCANLLPYMLPSCGNDPALLRRYAKGLAFLGHSQEAETCFAELMRSDPYWLNRLAYARFLHRQLKYEEASVEFSILIKHHCDDIDKSSVFVSYAKTLSELERMEMADRYFRFACHEAADDAEQAKFSRSMYATFLYNCKRFADAEKQQSVVLQLDGSDPRGHYEMACILVELRKHKQYVKHLKITLNLDPEHLDAKRDLACFQHKQEQKRKAAPDAEQKRSECEYEVYEEEEEKATMVQQEKQTTQQHRNHAHGQNGNVHQDEFNCWWFTAVGRSDDDTFNEYHYAFETNELNDIRIMLGNENLYDHLQSKIGINNLEHCNEIMAHVLVLRDEYDTFVADLRQNQLEPYQHFFQTHAIYTHQSASRKFTKKKGLQKLIKHYVHSQKKTTKAVDENDHASINALWKFIRNANNQRRNN